MARRVVAFLLSLSNVKRLLGWPALGWGGWGVCVEAERGLEE